MDQAKKGVDARFIEPMNVVGVPERDESRIYAKNNRTRTLGRNSVVVGLSDNTYVGRIHIIHL